MKIYTKTGDKGETSLVDGKRVAKNHPRVEAYGTVDELNSILGMCVSMSTLSIASLPAEVEISYLKTIQNSLFNLGSRLACESETRRNSLPPITSEHIKELESRIDRMSEILPPLKEFILPGGHIVASLLHQARTVCRRAERNALESEEIRKSLLEIQFLNRLSDYLFMLSRFVNFKTNTNEITWKKD